ncbi:MAG: PotD/PotF family extracellular solute-binding protein [Clostridiales bacterium]|nr:PotD/PotF family extracellular solute-binding protein [Clostridiales bacterium]
MNKNSTPLLFIIAFIYAAISICLCGALAAAAEPADMERAAAELKAMGMLQGDGNGLGLDEPCNRLHGAVLFTRLLGQEQEALNNRRPHPFLDIGNESWVAPYLGYLYNHGLAYGQAYNHYGAGPMLPVHFATFCLRALGYTEGSVNSDFQWGEALNVMVEKKIISGNLRNRMHNTPMFTRGDAVLLAYATLTAEMKEGGQTLFQHLLASGAVDADKAAAFSGAKADILIAYPQGLLADETLVDLAAQNSLSLAGMPYAPGPQGEEELYRELRQPQHSYAICVVPGYLVERLRQDGLLRKFIIREFGGRDAFVPATRDNPYWYDAKNSDYYALPLAFEQPCLYYDSSRVQNPDWSWLFRAAYSGGVYMPADPAMLTTLALHYYGLPYAAPNDKQLAQATSLLSGQAAAVPAYLDEHMLDIAEREGAVFGVLSSRYLPELARRREEQSAYSNWRAITPPSGAPITVYYAVMMQSAGAKTAQALLRGLLQPQTAAINAQYGGYLPAVSGAAAYLSGALAEAYPQGRWERCRLLHPDAVSRSLYEQTARNALLEEAKNAGQAELAALEFSFKRDGYIYRAYQIDFQAQTAAPFWAGEDRESPQFTGNRKLNKGLINNFLKEAAGIGVTLWKEYYDGPDDGHYWQMTLTFADGAAKTCAGHGLPLTWQDLAAALLVLCGEEVIPPTL